MQALCIGLASCPGLCLCLLRPPEESRATAAHSSTCGCTWWPATTLPGLVIRGEPTRSLVLPLTPVTSACNLYSAYAWGGRSWPGPFLRPSSWVVSQGSAPQTTRTHPGIQDLYPDLGHSCDCPEGRFLGLHHRQIK